MRPVLGSVCPFIFTLFYASMPVLLDEVSVELFADKEDRLISVGTIVGFAAFMLLMPDAGTKSADAIQKHVRSRLC